MALSNSDKLFCTEYLKDFNGTRAYKVAHPKCSNETARRNASKKLTKTDIQDFIQSISNQRLEKNEIDVDYIISNIKEVTERCMQKEPVEYFDKVDREWKYVTEYVEVNGEEVEARVMKFDASNALKGLELLGKYKNIFSENIKLSGSIENIQKDMNAISAVASQMHEVSDDEIDA